MRTTDPTSSSGPQENAAPQQTRRHTTAIGSRLGSASDSGRRALPTLVYLLVLLGTGMLTYYLNSGTLLVLVLLLPLMRTQAAA